MGGKGEGVGCVACAECAAEKWPRAGGRLDAGCNAMRCDVLPGAGRDEAAGRLAPSSMARLLAARVSRKRGGSAGPRASGARGGGGTHCPWARLRRRQAAGMRHDALMDARDAHGGGQRLSATSTCLTLAPQPGRWCQLLLTPERGGGGTRCSVVVTTPRALSSPQQAAAAAAAQLQACLPHRSTPVGHRACCPAPVLGRVARRADKPPAASRQPPAATLTASGSRRCSCPPATCPRESWLACVDPAPERTPAAASLRQPPPSGSRVSRPPRYLHSCGRALPCLCLGPILSSPPAPPAPAPRCPRVSCWPGQPASSRPDTRRRPRHASWCSLAPRLLLPPRPSPPAPAVALLSVGLSAHAPSTRSHRPASQPAATDMPIARPCPGRVPTAVGGGVGGASAAPANSSSFISAPAPLRQILPWPPPLHTAVATTPAAHSSSAPCPSLGSPHALPPRASGVTAPPWPLSGKRQDRV